jgi:hypothetical protein
MKLSESARYSTPRIVILSILLAIVTTAQAVITINPGETVVLEIGDDLTCQETLEGPLSSEDGIPLTGNCVTNEEDPMVDPRHQNIIAYTGLSSVGLSEAQRASATARLINEFEIPVAPAGEGVEVLPVQIATEVTWSGILLAAGFNSTFAQVIATLQVRDIATGLVVASNTFLFERVDADLSLDVLDAIEAVDITNSSGADITALLVPGRTYSIEVEAKCDVSVPLIGAAVCSFFADPETDLPLIRDLFGGDGFDVASITVTVDTDPVAHVAGN